MMMLVGWRAGTPVLDLKPYLPPYDSFPDASLGWLGEMLATGHVRQYKKG